MFINVAHVYPEIHLEIEYFHNYVILRAGSSHYYCPFLISRSVLFCETLGELKETIGLSYSPQGWVS